MRVFMRKDGGTLLIEPLVAVRVVEVPVSVDQVFDRIAAQAVHGIKDTGARSGDAGIDKHFAVGACQDGDVATRSLDDRDIAAQLVELDGRFRRVIANQVHDFAWLGGGIGRTEPAAVGVETSGDRTADTKTAAGQDLGIAEGHRAEPPADQDRLSHATIVPVKLVQIRDVANGFISTSAAGEFEISAGFTRPAWES